MTNLEEVRGVGVHLVGEALVTLLKNPEVRTVFIGGGPFVERSVGVLGSEKLWLQQIAVDILYQVAVDPEGARSMAGVPGCLMKLIACVGRKKVKFSELAGMVLSRLTGAGDLEVRRRVAEVPGVWEILVGALNNGSAPSRAAAGANLCNLAADAESRGAMVHVPGCLGGLFRLLESELPAARSAAVHALVRLARDGAVEKAVVGAATEVPGVIKTLVAELFGSELATMRAHAGDVLAALATEAENAKTMVSLPGFLGGGGAPGKRRRGLRSINCSFAAANLGCSP